MDDKFLSGVWLTLTAIGNMRDIILNEMGHCRIGLVVTAKVIK